MSSGIGLVTGTGGSGKSTLLEGAKEHNMSPGMVELLAQNTAQGRVFVVDILGNLNVGGMTFNSPEQLRLFLRAEFQGLQTNPPGIYRLNPSNEAQRRDFFRVLTLGGNARDGAVPGWIVIDEAKQVLGPRRVCEEAMWTVDFGRNFKQSVIAVGRRPNVLHRNLRQNCTFVFTFAQNDASEFPPGMQGDAHKIEGLGEHTFTALGTVPDALSDLRTFPNFEPL